MDKCDYCHSIGACPKCWGQAGYDRLNREKAALLEALERLETMAKAGNDAQSVLEHVRAVIAQAKGYMARAITVGKLQDQLGMAGPRPFLYCDECGQESSAHAGDYFNVPDDYIFRCCGQNMRFVTRHSYLTEHA